MSIIGGDVKMEHLSRYIFVAPSWPMSIAIIVALGFLIDGASLRFDPNFHFFGSLAFTLPALCGFLLTGPLVAISGRQITWNRSALLALSCTVLGVIITLTGLVASKSLLPLSYAIALGFIFGSRLIVLVSIADYRISRMVLPAVPQSGAGILLGMIFFRAAVPAADPDLSPGIWGWFYSPDMGYRAAPSPGIPYSCTQLCSRRCPPATLVILLGVAYALALKVDGTSWKGALGLHLPAATFPTWSDVATGFWCSRSRSCRCRSRTPSSARARCSPTSSPSGGSACGGSA